MPFSSWRLWSDLLKRAIAQPAAFLRVLSFKNVRTLLHALQHEPPMLILQNFRRLLQGQERLKLYSDQYLFEYDHFQLYFERIFFHPTKIELYGWIAPTANTTLEKVSIGHTGQVVGEAALNTGRDDLKRRFGSSSNPVGFEYLGPRYSNTTEWHVQVKISGHPPVDVLVPERDEAARYRTHLLLTETTEAAPRKIRRLLRKHKKHLPRFGLFVTDAQWEALELHRPVSPYPFHCQRLKALPGEAQTIDYVVQLSPGEQPSKALLWQLAATILKQPTPPALLYWDEDTLLSGGDRAYPHYKPAFNQEYLLSWNYIGYNFAAARTYLQGPQTHPLDICRQLSRDQHHRIVRIPEVLSHTPEINKRDEEWETTARTRFLQQHHPGARLTEGLLPCTFRVKHALAQQPRVTILIPFRDKVGLLRQCLDSLQAFTAYPNWEVLLINNQSKEAATLQYLQSLKGNERIRQYDYNAPFNYAAMHNAAVKRVGTPYVLLLNNDIEATASGWLEAMMEYARQENVGAVGARLLYPDDTLQHAGVLIGIGGVADHAHKHLPVHAPGYFNRAGTIQNLSACTAACLLMRTALYRNTGGMDEQRFPVAFNDVDLCLRLRQQGYDIVYTPHATLYHHESVSRGKDISPEQKQRASREIRDFRKKWRTFLDQGDPYYHPKLALNSAYFHPA